MPALPSSVLEPLWLQFAALLPARQVHHPLGCHRRRVPDRVIFDKLVQILVFGCGYRRIADQACSATTLRRRRDEWITLGVAERLRRAVLGVYDRLFGLELALACWAGGPRGAVCRPRTALYATLEQLRHLPGDPWPGIRAAALGVLQSGGAAGRPDAVDR